MAISYTVKKVREFPVPSRDVTTKLSLGGNNDVITELFLPRGSLVSDIPAEDWKLVNLFLRCTYLFGRYSHKTHFFYQYLYQRSSDNYSSIGDNRTEKLRIKLFWGKNFKWKKTGRGIKTWNSADDSYKSHECHKWQINIFCWINLPFVFLGYLRWRRRRRACKSEILYAASPTLQPS